MPLPLYAHLAHADVARGIHYRRPGIVRQGHPVFGAIGTHFPFGVAGDQHGIDAATGLVALIKSTYREISPSKKWLVSTTLGST